MRSICGRPVMLSLEYFASWIRRSEMECAALAFSYVVNLERDNSLKWVLFNIVCGQITSSALRK